MYSESHCHLRDITKEAVKEAEKLGFTLLLTSGIDLDSSIQAVQVAEKYDIVKACVGVHPWYADDYNENVEAKFRELAENKQVVAISEIGLDFIGRMTKEWVREDTFIDKEIQLNTLNSQLTLAYELGLPAIVHDRAPEQDLLDILMESKNLETGLAIHGYSKDLAYGQRCLSENVYLSVGLRTIQQASPEFLEAIKGIPMESLLTETDSGNPKGVLEVCNLIGKEKDLDPKEVGAKATENLMKLINA